MQELMSYIDRFLSNITENKHKALLERRETEEEAREYFGDEFIKQFNSIKMTEDLTDERYKYILKSLSYNLGKIKKIIPKLKDKATALKEIEEENKKFSMFDDNSSTNDISTDDYFEFDAGDWDEEEEENVHHR